MRAAQEASKYKEARSAMREQGRSKTGLALLPHVELAPMSAHTGERREHLNAVVAFAGAREKEAECSEYLTCSQ